MLALIAAELMAAGVAGARLLEVDYATAAIIAACAVFACFILRGMSGAPWVNGVLFPIMLVAVLVPLVQLSRSMVRTAGAAARLRQRAVANPGA